MNIGNGFYLRHVLLRHVLLRHVLVRLALCSLIPLGALLSACGGTPVSGLLPSQSGTLANASAGSLTSPTPAKRFNPFSDEDNSAGRRVVIEQPTFAQVMQAGPLPEQVIGRADAPFTVVKYASMTCPYCRQFQSQTFPILKKRYIDTGKIRFILREFPIGFQSGAATVALRCVAPEKYFDAYAALLKAQPQWISQEVRHDPIYNVVKRFGLSRAQFDACYKDEKLIADLNAVKERGRTLGVIGTPNFFVNNKLFKSVLTMTDFDRIVTGDNSLASAAATTTRQ